MSDTIKVYKFTVDVGSSINVVVEGYSEAAARDAVDELLYGEKYIEEMTSLENVEVIINLEGVENPE
jgi:hypothetical protein